MIANSQISNLPRRSSHSNTMLVLEPPRHSDLSISILIPGRHLVGTDEGCGIRLQAEGVQSRHALIIAGDQKVLLKALDSRTWVNDHSVTDTVLRSGDRLSIGPITFRIRTATQDELDQLFEGSSPAVVTASTAQVPPLNNASPTPIVTPVTIDPLADVTIMRSDVAVTAAPAPMSGAKALDTPLHDVPLSPEELHHQSAILKSIPVLTRVSIDQQRLDAREAELKQLAKSLSVQSQQQLERTLQLDAREAEVERKIARLSDENDRLLKTAHDARQVLVDESQRQQTLWKEWDAAYQRSASEMKDQFESLERQRELLRSERLVLDQKKDEIQKLQQDAVAEKVRHTEQIARLQLDRAAFETERRQNVTQWNDLQSQLEHDRKALECAQRELDSARQRLDSDVEAFAFDRSAEIARLTQEIQEQSAIKKRLLEAESVIGLQTQELERHQQEIEDERRLLQDDRQALENERTEIEILRNQLAEQQRIEQARAVSADEFNQRQIEFESSIQRRQQELEAWQHRLETQQEIEDERRLLQDDRQALENERTEIEILRNQLAEQQRIEQARAVSADEFNQRQIEFESSIQRRQQELEAWQHRLETQQEIEDERRLLQDDRQALENARTEIETLRHQLAEQQRIEQSRAVSADEFKQRQIEFESSIQRRQQELETWQHRLETQQAQLDADRLDLQLQHQKLTEELNYGGQQLAGSLSGQKTGHSQVGPESKQPDEWLQITDTVDQLLGIYGVNPSTDLARSDDPLTHSTSPDADFGGNSRDLLKYQPTEYSGVETHSGRISNAIDNRQVEPYGLNYRYEFDLPNSSEASSGSYRLKSLSETALHDILPEKGSEYSRLESDVRQSTAEAAVADIPEVEVADTLTDVNHRFGYVSNPQFASQTDSLHHHGFCANPASAEPVESDISEYVHGTNSAPDDQLTPSQLPSQDPLSDLRAKLAQMFELQDNGATSESSHSNVTSDSAQLRQESVAGDLELRNYARVDDVKKIEEQSSVANHETDMPPEHLPVDSAIAASEDVVAEDDPWTRRLRELAAVVDEGKDASPQPPPVPVVEESGPEANVDAEEDDEFSVEVQLARLLGRPLKKKSDEEDVDSSDRVAVSSNEPDVIPSGSDPIVPATDGDRSHLTKGPRHKQDKDAVREEVQSFRAVAQMSAQKALERHSWNSFKNEFYFSLTLLIVTVTVSAWYVGSYCFGMDETPWKAIACVLAAVLCVLNILRLFSRLRARRLKKSAAAL